MNNHAQWIAQSKGYYDGLHGLPNRNPYKSRTGKRLYDIYYRYGKIDKDKAGSK